MIRIASDVSFACGLLILEVDMDIDEDREVIFNDPSSYLTYLLICFDGFKWIGK